MVGLDSAGKTTILYRLQVSLSTTLCTKGAENRLEKLFLLSQVCPPIHPCGTREKVKERMELTCSNWIQCRDCFLQEYQFPSMGSRRSIEYPSILEMLLCEYTGTSSLSFQSTSELASCPLSSSLSLGGMLTTGNNLRNRLLRRFSTPNIPLRTPNNVI
jgi:hypothetical protein